MFVVCSLESNPGSVLENGMKNKRLGVRKGQGGRRTSFQRRNKKGRKEMMGKSQGHLKMAFTEFDS